MTTLHFKEIKTVVPWNSDSATIHVHSSTFVNRYLFAESHDDYIQMRLDSNGKIVAHATHTCDKEEITEAISKVLNEMDMDEKVSEKILDNGITRLEVSYVFDEKEDTYESVLHKKAIVLTGMLISNLMNRVLYK